MRTTVNIPDRLLAAAKKRAQERDTTLSTVIADALRLAFARPVDREVGHFTLVTFRGDGVLPGVDLTRTSELLDMDDVDVLTVSDSHRQRAPHRVTRRKTTKR